MHEDGSLDLDRFRRLIDFHLKEGADGFIIVGTTGESPTVDWDEHRLLIKTAIDHVDGRKPVIAGTGANSTREAIELSAYAKEAGADMGLSVVPYYNKPTQEGMYQHFKAIVEAVDLPQIVYNVPGRTVADLSNDTLLRLAKIPNIVGVKDATGNLERGVDLLRLAPADFAVYSGDDGTALPLMLVGGHGVISVTANVAPRLMHEMCVAAIAGDTRRARELNNKLMPLHKSLFVEPNPTPVKWVAEQMGLVDSGIRLPLTRLSPQHHDLLRTAMRHAELAG